jgi:hypothetical protein
MRRFLPFAVLGIVGVLGLGCNAILGISGLDPDDGGTEPNDGGTDTSDGGTPKADGGTKTDDAGDAGSGLYARLGGRTGIATAVKEIIEGANGELTDPQIASYFLIRTGKSGGDPSVAVIEDCFTNFMGTIAGGPSSEVPYPFTSIVGGTSFTCRSMAPAHSGLGVTNAAFQKFVTILASKLTSLGVSQADLQTVGGGFLGTSADVIDSNRNKSQLEAGGFDPATAAANYGARCGDIAGGQSAAPGCAQF